MLLIASEASKKIEISVDRERSDQMPMTFWGGLSSFHSSVRVAFVVQPSGGTCLSLIGARICRSRSFVNCSRITHWDHWSFMAWFYYCPRGLHRLGIFCVFGFMFVLMFVRCSVDPARCGRWCGPRLGHRHFSSTRVSLVSVLLLSATILSWMWLSILSGMWLSMFLSAAAANLVLY
jgi:hypothetical protein